MLDLPSNFFKYKIPFFEKHKKIIKELINKIPKNPYVFTGQRISHTDYTLPKSVKREYASYLDSNVFQDYAKYLIKDLKLNFDYIDRKDIWFQVYEKGDFHSRHTHGGCHFTNILYIQLPKKTKTKIYDINNQEIMISVSEGDILTFPSYLVHESPLNRNDESKIIISFNTNIILNT